MSLATLKPASYNPRRIGDAAMAGLKASLGRWGLVQPVIWNKRTGSIVGGHQRVTALLDAGEREADVVVVDLPLTEEKALNVALNSPAISGEFTADIDQLLDEIRASMPDLYDDLLLDELRGSGAPPDAPEVVEDEVPPVPEVAVTKPGDLWLLGEHRLLCGDSTQPADVNRLLNGESIAMCFTDPPWNVAIGLDSNPRHRQRPRGLRNDNLPPEQFEAFLSAFITTMQPALKGDLYCVLGASEWPTLDRALRGHGFHWSATIVWVKDQFVLGRSKYHRRYEPIWYGWHSGSKSSYSGARDQDDVWEFDRPRVSEEHPTMKPVGLAAKAIGNSSRANNIVFDPFGGSGSTLIAAQQLNRRAFLMELEPVYVDVIVKRWEKFTGQKAVLDGATSKRRKGTHR